MNKPIKVLFVHGGTLEKAGTEAFMMNVFRHVNRAHIHIDFMVFGRKEGAYDKEVISSGSKIYRVPYTFEDIKRKGSSFRLIRKMIQHEHYDIVHAHMNALNAPVLSYMKRIGIPVRISHSHGSRHFVDNKVIIRLKERMKRQIPKYATHLLSCSKEAGDFLYPGNLYTIMNNGIDTEHYSFDAHVREEVRSSLGINDAFVLGHVGRFNFQKNHDFLIDVFYEYTLLDASAKLMLLGDGELRGTIMEKINRLGLTDKVLMLGIRDDVHRYYQGMDAFLLPSLFEGLPYVLVEAQCSGLLSLSSNTVDAQSKLIDDVYFLPIKNPKKWADTLFEHRNYHRVSSESKLKEKGFDVSANVAWLSRFYINAVKEAE